jgi:hypothetical protein
MNSPAAGWRYSLILFGFFFGRRGDLNIGKLRTHDRILESPENASKMFVEIGRGNSPELYEFDQNFLGDFQDFFIVCVHRILAGIG